MTTRQRKDEWHYQNVPTKRELEYLGLFLLASNYDEARKILSIRRKLPKEIFLETIEREGYDNPTT